MIVPARLAAFGFVDGGSACVCRRDVMEGVFTLEMTLHASGRITSRVFDAETGDEYALFRAGAGAYAAALRREVDAIESEARDAMRGVGGPHGRQATRLAELISSKWREQLEHLWPRSPEAAIVRRADNEKWYAVFMRVALRKLGVDSDASSEIIDLRAERDTIGAIADGKDYFPGWHMNKRHWYTILLDGEIGDDEIFDRICASRRIAGKR